MHCTSCGTVLEASQKFCGSCGAPMRANSQQSSGSQEVDTSELKSIVRTFHSKGSERGRIVDEVRRLLEKDKLEVQIISEGQSQIIQGRQQATNIFLKTAKKALGLEIAITISLESRAEDLVLRIGAAKWLDKGVGMAVAWFLLWPAALTSAWGIYMQKQLFKKIDEHCIRSLS